MILKRLSHIEDGEENSSDDKPPPSPSMIFARNTDRDGDSDSDNRKYGSGLKTSSEELSEFSKPTLPIDPPSAQPEDVLVGNAEDKEPTDEGVLAILQRIDLSDSECVLF